MLKRFVYILLTLFLATCLQGQDFYKTQSLRLGVRGYEELAPVPYKDGILFMLGRPESAPRKKTFRSTRGNASSDKPSTDIYYSAMEDERNWSAPELFSQSLKSQVIDGPVSVARNGALICITRMYAAEGGTNRNNFNQALFFADSAANGEWINLRPFEFNDPAFILTTPFLSRGGDSLYFAANYENALGGFDLYVSYNRNGSWTEPENLGNKINTSEDDLFPFLHKSGRLYFSSKGHSSRGDFDIFYCDQVDGTWIEARAMDSDFNRRTDEYSLVMSDDYSEGYFTRRGGSWDIYRFYTEYPKAENPRPIMPNKWKYRLRENSLDTIDHSIFDYEWVINDTLKLPGLEVIYQFPRPGDYYISFNVRNKVTDTTEYGVGELYIPIRRIEQPVFTCQDTARVNEAISFDARETHLPDFEIDDYYWDFGDGMKADGIRTTYAYSTPGKKEVVLTVREDARDNPETKSVFREIVILPED